jgi:hypothetical protein
MRALQLDQQPDIRKFKKHFSSEIFTASFWGPNILVGAKHGLSLLDRSGSGKVRPPVPPMRKAQRASV